MRQSPTRRVEHAVRRGALTGSNGQKKREATNGVVIAWPVETARPTTDSAVNLGGLEAENANLRNQVVELALAIQELRTAVGAAQPSER
jgi:hypothetical protein